MFQPLLLRSIVRSRPIIESTISDKSAAAFQFSSRIFEFHYVYNNRRSKAGEKTFPILLTKMGPKSGFHCHFIEFKFTPMLASTFALAFLTMGFTFGQSHFFHSRSCRWLHSTMLRPKGLFLKRRWSLKVWIVWHKRTKRVPFWCKALKIRIRNGFTKVLSRGCRYFVCANYNWNWLISPKKLQEMKATKKSYEIDCFWTLNTLLEDWLNPVNQLVPTQRSK